MFLYPKDIREKLEFNKIIDHLKSECLSDTGKHYFDHLEILSNIDTIQRLLNETEEYKKAIERGEHYPMGSFESITDDVALLRKEGYTLDIDSIRNIYRIVTLGLEMITYFQNPDRAKINPIINEIVHSVYIDRKLIDEIDRILDEEGEVRPDASPALMKISKSIRVKERELDQLFNSILETYRNQGCLVDTYESLRNGRRVLTVAVEHKRKVSGIIHDESATGKTVYIEPEHVVALNQQVYNLYAERRSEIYKILRALCDFIRPFADTLLAVQEILGKIDTIRAKARFAMRIQAVKPIVQQKPIFAFKEAFNPVLYIKNEAAGLPVVPFNLELHGNNRILILSGPNAGGKSVALKSVGLLQMMLQAGMLVTVNENSKFGIFKKIFSDIGDQQSIEDDLSTYSSHLRNMKIMTEESDKTTLVLIDEFGSGTDPKIGGAIAEAILKDLNHKKVFGVITTHYSNLKFFAFKEHGLVNGSMEFDQAHLLPTFRMHVGKPGSSFAYEIAAKTGLDERIIKYAQHKTGKNEKAIDDMLITLMAEKKEYEDKFALLLDKEDRLDKLIASYDHMHAELDIKSKKLKIQAKEASMRTVADQQHELKKLLKEIKHSKDEEKALQAAIAIKKKQETELKALESLKMEAFAKEIAHNARKIQVGSFVRLRDGSTTGEILSINKNIAEVQMGFMKLKLPLVDLVPVNEPVVSSQNAGLSPAFSKVKVDTEIDIREYTKLDAIQMVQEFMDQALMHNAYELKIIHGIGTGVLKNEVRKLLKQYKDIREIWHPDPDQGGEGVTFVRF
ncbi:MAG: Smr/MutS family protein [Chitinophagales bacterium]|nr:Smr/MutS family protein [Chitinophagales bacterium]